MSEIDIETRTVPPEIEEDGDGDDDSVRVSCHVIGHDETSFDAAVQLFGGDSTDPERFAEGLLGAALAVAALRGSDYSWAVMRRFAAYDGMPR